MKKKSQKNQHWILSSVFGVFFLILFLFLRIDQLNYKKENIITKKDNNCVITTEEKEVNGSSMEPLIKNGTTIRLLKNYQKCYELKRNDLVIYQYAGSKNPLIKKIQAIPNDKFELKKNKQNRWNIFINDKILKNSQNQKYAFTENKSKMLKLYAKSYPIIPKKTYLILGEKSGGTTDSSQFGLIHSNDILGKAEIKK